MTDIGTPAACGAGLQPSQAVFLKRTTEDMLENGGIPRF
jgi:hypothetical protein